MFRKATPLFLICETPLHAGSGNDLGVIDLPIQRERHTSFPKIEGSSLKGSLREAFENKLTNDAERKKIHLVFGYDDKTPENKCIKNHFGEDKQFQGALGFTDARLLLFPVKSMKGVFAWITCEKVLEQFKRDFALTDYSYPNEIPNQKTVPHECELIVNADNIVLEEYTFTVTKDPVVEGNITKLANWLADCLFDRGSYWYSHLLKNLVVLQDDDFTDFVNLSTEVITRTKINNNTGTVESGALFTEEYLPSESVMYSLAMFSPIFHKDEVKNVFFDGRLPLNGESQSDFEAKAVGDYFTKIITNELQVVQIGGNASLGKGLVRTKIIGREK